MSLASGTRLGQHEVTAPLGAGGMGEVYRATDTKLGREVAIKVLPAEVAGDAERLARFEREAKLLASLNHPNIAHVYGFESATQPDGSAVHFLAMELGDGENLAERLERGRIPIDEALSIAKQIAEALEEAHEKGIVHRDLKPANVKLASDGRVKVLDFGLAKAYAAEAASGSGSELSQSPTLAHTGTQAGLLLGTAAYMSPEQARGKPVDKRTDIWAFGVVLWEMLTGRQLFSGETVSDVLAAVLRQEIAWAALPASTPAALRGLLGRCLERDSKKRLRDVGEARILIDDVSAAEEAPQSAQSDERGRSRRLPWAMAALSAAIAVGSLMMLWRGSSAEKPVAEEAPARTSILMPAVSDADQVPGTFALAPDGTALVFRATDGSGKRRLFVRELAEPEARPLEGTEGASHPFWSGDSHDIGFFAGGELRRIPRSGGAVQRICAAKSGRGAAWNAEGTIVFAPEPYGPLSRVRASGGEPAPATVVEPKAADVSHRFPTFLPDGRHFLFVAEDSSPSRSWIRMASLDALTVGERLLDASSAPRFAAPDSLVFQREGALVAQTIDLERIAMKGEPRLLEDRPNLKAATRGGPVADVASNGRMLYAPPDQRPSAFVWLDRDGVERGSELHQEVSFQDLAISHRGDRVAAFSRSPDGSASIWVLDPERASASRITAPEQDAWGLAWSADDREIATWLSASAPGEAAASGEGSLSLVATASGGVRRLLPPSNRWMLPLDFSKDGRTLVYWELVSGASRDIGWLRLDGEPTEQVYLATPANESGARLSPDARWLAYVSDASGRYEAFLDTFPTPARAQRVTLDGEVDRVRFRADGRELLLVAAVGDSWAVFACDLRLGERAEIGPARKLFSLPPEWSGVEPAPAGDRFLLLRPAGSRWPSLTLVHNWRSQLATAGR